VVCGEFYMNLETDPTELHPQNTDNNSNAIRVMENKFSLEMLTRDERRGRRFPLGGNQSRVAARSYSGKVGSAIPGEPSSIFIPSEEDYTIRRRPRFPISFPRPAVVARPRERRQLWRLAVGLHPLATLGGGWSRR